MNCDIIIPTWNNPDYLFPLLRSLFPTTFARVIVVNNGSPESVAQIRQFHPMVTLVQAKENLGWEGGLKLGLEHSTAPHVCFLNDDTYIPDSSQGWLEILVSHLQYSGNDIAAVGPSSNVVMGLQNLFIPAKKPLFRVTFLIGFCMVLCRADLDAAGGIDDALPGGDDLDLSIRLRALGKHLLVDRSVFVYHHGFKTGERVHGADWNSIRQMEATQRALVAKHGLKKWHEMMAQQYIGDLAPREATSVA